MSMGMTKSLQITASSEILERRRKREHAHCFLCSNPMHSELGLRFEVDGEDQISASFECESLYQGYDGILHGGIVSLLFDEAMTNCLFAHDIRAVTAELTIRYILPVAISRSAKITASIKKIRPPLYCLEAEIIQDGEIKAKAKSKFMDFDP